MKKLPLRILSLALAASLVAGCGSASKELTNVNAVDKSLEQIVTVAAVSKTQSGNPNDTVYVVTKADGEIDKVFDEEESDLPVDIKISYTLDGKAVTPEELSGKSGHVTIRFDYTNNARSEVMVNGEKESMYVPFTVVSGLLLDNKKFSNVEIKNGKIVDDGNRTIALGLSFPGLSENLNVKSDKIDFEIPKYVEVSADVKDFSLDMTLSIVTNDVFSELKDKNIASIDDLRDSLDTLNDAMEQILDGSAKLYDGLNTLYNKVGDLSTGVNTLYTGSTELKDGASKLSDGASQVSSGSAELAGGLGKLAANNQTLNDAAKQVFDTLLQTASAQLQANGFNVNLTIDNYNETLDALVASLDADAVYQTAYSQVSAAVEANTPQITAAVTQAVRANVEATVTSQVRASVEAGAKEAVFAQMGLNDEVYASLDDDTRAAVDAAISGAVEAKMASDEITGLIVSTVNAQMETEEVKNIIANNVAAQKQALISQNMESPEVQSKLQAAAGGIVTITNLKASLNSYNQFYVGLKTYTAGVATASEGAKKLAGGAGQLAEGAKTLYEGSVALNDGLATLNDAMPELTDGVTQLRDGSEALNDGLNKFNEEGILKINDVITNDVETLINRFKATVDVSKNYRANSTDSENTAIKFIYRSEAIK